MSERIKQLRKTLNLSQTAFGERLGVSRDVINNIERGRNKNPLSDIFIHHLCSTFNVNETWLRTGEGDMFAPVDNSALRNLQQQYDLSEDDIEIIQGYLSLPLAQRELFAKFLKSMTFNND